MLDNELISLLISIINAGLTLRSVSGVKTFQAYQPTQQGIIETQTVLISKLADYRRGSPERIDLWDSINNVMIHTELQVYETHYQIGSLYPQNPKINTLTASDLLNTVAQILQSNDCIDQLFSNDVQILRITDVRNPYFKDDRDLFEMSPSMDIALTHKQIFSNNGTFISLINSGIYRI